MLIERLLMLDGVSGETVIEIPVDERFRQRYGNPYAVTHRADIHGSLLDACKARPNLIELRTHCRVTGFRADDRGVSVDVANQKSIRTSGLIGADGFPVQANRRDGDRRYRATCVIAVLAEI